MGRHAAATLASLALAASCLTSGCVGAAGPAAPIVQAGTAGCPGRDLSVSTVRRGSTAAVSVAWLVIVNSGRRSCAVTGRPRIDATAATVAGPKRVEVLARGFGVPMVPVGRVELAGHGGTASFLVGAALAGAGPCEQVHGYTVTLAGAAGPIAARGTLPNCEAAVSVSPVFAGRRPPVAVPALGLGFVPVSAAFWTARIGLVGGDVTHAACQSRCPGEVEVTTDGGASWRVVLRTRSPIASVRAGGAGWGLVRTVTTEQCARRRGCPGRLYRTSDGGRTWIVAGHAPRGPLRTPCGAQPEVAVSVTSTAAWALCGNDPATDLELGKRLYRSAGGGRSWTLVPARLPLVGVIAGVSFDAAGTGFAWFDRGGLVITPDAGHTWRSLPVIDPASADAGCDGTIVAQPLPGSGAVLLDERCTGPAHTVDLRISANDGRTWRLARSWLVPSTYGTGQWP
jgi:hypothetical protein